MYVLGDFVLFSEFKSCLFGGEVCIDVRTGDEYNKEHIKGTANLPRK